ncbi:hypothetical protein [Sphaerimonospora thailandensis]|uniref:Uncharacterized protein n=1 Tax=Sphaerimonospora thailandensis TaxID=795644 RepID=A0A8J3W215_9ACTN|nr:hypothetical protein [Sphaerimonospora thailandensis]GIH72830.1 hypothetical protein Mth01_50830 [Sphaerimonospora thailandensis]
MTVSNQLTTFTVELPVAFDPRWNRIPGITVDGTTVTVDPEKYFFRFENSTWLLCDWQRIADELLGIEETAQTAVEQLALEFVKTHGFSTPNAGQVLATAWEVYRYLFRDEHLPSLDLPKVTADHLRMLREAATFMALNKVELDGHISNVGPCWFFPAATSVVFDLDEEEGGMLDEVYHGTWFNEYRRIESIKAHAALGGRLVHGCQSVPNQSGGACVPYGASMQTFRTELTRFREEWISQVYACRTTAN